MVNWDNKILSGKKLADEILTKIKSTIKNIQKQRKPQLCVILVGDDPASHVYVTNKRNACNQVGIISTQHILPSTTTNEELFTLIDQLNNDTNIDGILVQLPLPKHLNSKKILETILPHKDVDGFHRHNMGALALNDPLICPCTPHGVMYMLDSLKVEYFGLNVVILGTSNIVGRPMALELLNRGATVTICNSKTQNLSELTSKADVIIAAVGKPNLVKSEWVKPGSIIIDVGINRLANGSLCGDVDLQNVIDKVSFITPVPGGVGPMTIAMLMKNTLHCYNKHMNQAQII